MSTDRSFLIGFVKRANEYGYSEEEALNIFKQAQAPVRPGFRTNNQINAGIATRNANPNPTPGSAAIMDFPQKGVPVQKTSPYTPTNTAVPMSRGAIASAVPVLGHVAGPVARAAEGDFIGAGIDTLSNAALMGGPAGIIPSTGLSYLNKARDVGRHINQQAAANNRFEQQNTIPQG